MPTKNRAAVALGRRGGKANTPAQQAARRANGAKGGRPAMTDTITIFAECPACRRKQMTKFQTVQSHNEIACFNCAKPLADVAAEDSGFAPRHGEYKKECQRCGMKTWYDLKGGAR